MNTPYEKLFPKVLPLRSRAARIFRSAMLALSAIGGIAGAVACGSDDGPAATDAEALQGFRGVTLSTTGEQGVFDLRVTNGQATRGLSFLASTPLTLSGTVVVGSIRASVTGSYNPDTGAVTITGTATVLGVAVGLDAVYRDGRLSGTYTVDGVPSGTLEGLGIGLEPIELYCGTTSGRPGTITFASSGNFAGGAVCFTGQTPKAFAGTKSGASFSMTYPPDGRVAGSASSGTLTGTFTDGIGSGTFTASTAACPSLGSVGDGGTADSGEIDGSAESGDIDAGPAPDSAISDTSLPDTSLPDGGAGPLLTLSGTGAKIAIVGDYFFAGGGPDLTFIKKDGTGKGTIINACSTGCLDLVAHAGSVYGNDGADALRKFTPPSTTVPSPIGTTSLFDKAGLSDGTYLYYIRQTTQSIHRVALSPFGVTNSEAFNPKSFAISGSTLFTTQQGTALVQKRPSDFSSGAVDVVLASAIAPNDFVGSIVADGNEIFFLATQGSVQTNEVIYEQAGSNAPAVVATIDTTPYFEARPILDATNVYVIRTTPAGIAQIVYYARTVRGATTPTVLYEAPVNYSITNILADATHIFAVVPTSSATTEIWKIAKP